MLFQLVTGELEVEASNEDLALGVGEFDPFFRVITVHHAVLLDDLHVRIGLLDVLSIVHHEVAAVHLTTTPVVVILAAPASHVVAPFSPALMIVC